MQLLLSELTEPSQWLPQSPLPAEKSHTVTMSPTRDDESYIKLTKHDRNQMSDGYLVDREHSRIISDEIGPGAVCLITRHRRRRQHLVRP